MVSTWQTSASLSPRVSKDARHVDSFLASFSMRGRSVEEWSLHTDSGRPSYLIGKGATGQERVVPMVTAMSSVRWMGVMEHFS